MAEEAGLLIALGKPKKSPPEKEDTEDSPKLSAASALKSAIDSGDSGAIAEAIETVLEVFR